MAGGRARHGPHRDRPGPSPGEEGIPQTGGTDKDQTRSAGFVTWWPPLKACPEGIGASATPSCRSLCGKHAYVGSRGMASGTWTGERCFFRPDALVKRTFARPPCCPLFGATTERWSLWRTSPWQDRLTRRVVNQISAVGGKASAERVARVPRSARDPLADDLVSLLKERYNPRSPAHLRRKSKTIVEYIRAQKKDDAELSVGSLVLPRLEVGAASGVLRLGQADEERAAGRLSNRPER